MNAYTLTFAVLLLTGAALGDRFGRRRLFVSGSPSSPPRRRARRSRRASRRSNIARALQGVGGAIVTPLTLTLLSRGRAGRNRRGLALGAWGGIGGLAVALGPLVGGAVVSGISWQWIFWLNVPIGLVLVPLALAAAGGELRPDRQARPARARPRQRRAARDRLGPRAREQRRLGLDARSSARSRPAPCSSRCSSLWELRTERRCCRCASSATGRSPRRTSRRCSCSSGCSARSSCSRSSSRPCRATRRSARACASCRGRRCR